MTKRRNIRYIYNDRAALLMKINFYAMKIAVSLKTGENTQNSEKLKIFIYIHKERAVYILYYETDPVKWENDGGMFVEVQCFLKINNKWKKFRRDCGTRFSVIQAIPQTYFSVSSSLSCIALFVWPRTPRRKSSAKPRIVFQGLTKLAPGVQ